MPSTLNLLSLLGLIAAAAAATHDILVGNGGLAYSPNSTAAAQGDTVVFHFYPGGHNVVQSDFNTPCSTTGGFYSGFIDSQSGAAADTFTITINDTSPIWIYCSQVEHCQLGMVMVINPPSSGDTLSAYAAAAAKTSTSTTPGSVGGGVISSGSGSGSGSSSASSVSPASSSAASAGSTAASSSASQAVTGSATSTSTSASASPTGNGAGVVRGEAVLSGLAAVVAAVAFWAGLV